MHSTNYLCVRLHFKRVGERAPQLQNYNALLEMGKSEGIRQISFGGNGLGMCSLPRLFVPFTTLYASVAQTKHISIGTKKQMCVCCFGARNLIIDKRGMAAFDLTIRQWRDLVLFVHVLPGNDMIKWRKQKTKRANSLHETAARRWRQRRRLLRHQHPSTVHTQERWLRTSSPLHREIIFFHGRPQRHNTRRSTLLCRGKASPSVVPLRTQIILIFDWSGGTIVYYDFSVWRRTGLSLRK